MKYKTIKLVDIYQQISYHAQNQKKEENDISTMKKMNEACIWQYIFLGELGGGVNNVDIILRGVVT